MDIPSLLLLIDSRTSLFQTFGGELRKIGDWVSKREQKNGEGTKARSKGSLVPSFFVVLLKSDLMSGIG